MVPSIQSSIKKYIMNAAKVISSMVIRGSASSGTGRRIIEEIIGHGD
jgi:hypothetical protein